jgi:hypothetical protein
MGCPCALALCLTGEIVFWFGFGLYLQATSLNRVAVQSSLSSLASSHNGWAPLASLLTKHQGLSTTKCLCCVILLEYADNLRH